MPELSQESAARDIIAKCKGALRDTHFAAVPISESRFGEWEVRMILEDNQRRLVTWSDTTKEELAQAIGVLTGKKFGIGDCPSSSNPTIQSICSTDYEAMSLLNNIKDLGLGTHTGALQFVKQDQQRSLLERNPPRRPILHVNRLSDSKLPPTDKMR